MQICLWEAGHAITSPGAGFYDWQMRSFDAGSEDRMGLVDYIMRAIEGTCHDRGLCNVSRNQLGKAEWCSSFHHPTRVINTCHHANHSVPSLAIMSRLHKHGCLLLAVAKVCNQIYVECLSTAPTQAQSSRVTLV